VDWLYLTSRTDALSRPLRLLHVAPEVALEIPLRKLAHVSYLSADYDSTLAMEHIDLCDITYDDDSFDAIICNHVLQVVRDDRAALREIFRVLRPGGWALLQASYNPSVERTIDHPVEVDEAGRYEEVFMRTYGRDYPDRLQEAGFTVTVSQFVRELDPAVQRELGLDLDETIFFCRTTKAHAPASS
jgi:SAM-dependent methyltransferase